MELIQLNEVVKVLEEFAIDIRDRYKDVLTSHDRIASRNLIDSIKTNVVVGDKEFLVTMTLADYWKYVEYGSAPHWPPMSAIQRWIEVKPVIPRPGNNGKIPTTKQLAYLISRKISIEGTEGSHDLDKTKEDILPWYRQRISEALGHDIAMYLGKFFA